MTSWWWLIELLLTVWSWYWFFEFLSSAELGSVLMWYIKNISENVGITWLMFYMLSPYCVSYCEYICKLRSHLSLTIKMTYTETNNVDTLSVLPSLPSVFLFAVTLMTAFLWGLSLRVCFHYGTHVFSFHFAWSSLVIKCLWIRAFMHPLWLCAKFL